MFQSRKLNNKINKLHERCLQIVYSDNTSSFEELLETDNSVSVHQRNIQVLATELYKIINGLSPKIMKEVSPFNENTSYNTRNKRKFHLRSIKLVTFGSEMLSHLKSGRELVPVSLLRELLRNGNQETVLIIYADVCFSGWFRVIDFMIRHKLVLLFFFFSFCFYQKITRLFL